MIDNFSIDGNHIPLTSHIDDFKSSIGYYCLLSFNWLPMEIGIIRDATDTHVCFDCYHYPEFIRYWIPYTNLYSYTIFNAYKSGTIPHSLD